MAKWMQQGIPGAGGPSEVPMGSERQRNRNLSNQQFLYHGTVTTGLKEILPAREHKRAQFYPGEHDGSYAYATKSLDDAKNWAEKAYHSSDKGEPLVYRVTPKGPTEQDPLHYAHGGRRGTTENDQRSKHGFTVDRVEWASWWDQDR